MIDYEVNPNQDDEQRVLMERPEPREDEGTPEWAYKGHVRVQQLQTLYACRFVQGQLKIKELITLPL